MPLIRVVSVFRESLQPKGNIKFVETEASLEFFKSGNGQLRKERVFNLSNIEKTSSIH